MRECTHFVEAEQPRNLGYMQLGVIKVSICQIAPQLLGRLGIWYPVDRLDGAGIRQLLRTVEELGHSTLWYPEALGYESLSIASFMLDGVRAVEGLFHSK